MNHIIKNKLWNIIGIILHETYYEPNYKIHIMKHIICNILYETYMKLKLNIFVSYDMIHSMFHLICFI